LSFIEDRESQKGNVTNFEIQRYPKGVFSVTQICSRTRDWSACVAPAKNNIICVFIVKRDKRMRDAGRYPTAEHPHA
jgi:hypothetical protein